MFTTGCTIKDRRGTSFGANLCFLKDREEGELAELVETEASWLSQWLKEIMRWEHSDVDEGRVTWLKIFRIPCHAWNFNFFDFL